MAKCSRGRMVAGLSDAREGAGFFYNATAQTPGGEHAVLRYLRCLPLFGIPIPEHPEFFLPPGNPPTFRPGGVVLHPFARGAGKSLDVGVIRAFVEEFQTRSSHPVILVGMGEMPQLPGNVLNLVGKTSLPELIGILRGARFVVSVDSGPMHLAAALGIPLLGIHTWSDPRLVGPFSEQAWIWQGGGIRLQDVDRPPLEEKPFSPDAAREIARFVAEKTR